MIYSQQETQKYTVKQVEQYLQKIKEKYVYTNYNLPFPVRQILKDCFIVSTISYSIIDEKEIPKISNTAVITKKYIKYLITVDAIPFKVKLCLVPFFSK